MPTYNAPLKDMMFLFENLRNNKNYNEIEKYKEFNSDLVKDILQQAAKINQELILPLAKIGDQKPCVYENGVVRSPPGYKEAYKIQLDNFIDCINNNKPTSVNYDDGRNALIVANGAVESFKSGKFITINFD